MSLVNAYRSQLASSYEFKKPVKPLRFGLKPGAGLDSFDKNCASIDRVECSSPLNPIKNGSLACEPVIRSKLMEMAPETIVTEGTRVFVDPANRSKLDNATFKLALKQAHAARNLLYFPNLALKEELAKAASSLQAILKEMSNSELPILTKFEFGPGGYCPGWHPKELHSILERLIDKKSATALDRIVFISMIGNLGHRFIDKYGSNQPTAEAPDDFLKIAKSNGLPNLSPDKIKRLYWVTHYRTIEPRKRILQPEENAEIRIERDKNPQRYRLRTGIHNLGGQVDDYIGVVHGRIPGLRWQTGLIDVEMVARTKEPLVDQMATRCLKALMIWDMLCGEEPEKAYRNFLQKKSAQKKIIAADPNHQGVDLQKRLARLAGVSSVAVGAGFHSAYEVLGGLKYLGTDFRKYLNPKQEPEDVFGDGVATEMVVDLFNQHSANLNSKPHTSQLTFPEVEKYLARAGKK